MKKIIVTMISLGLYSLSFCQEHQFLHDSVNEQDVLISTQSNLKSAFKEEIVTEQDDFSRKYSDLAQWFKFIGQDFQKFMIDKMLDHDVHEMTQDETGQKIPLLAHTINQAEEVLTKSLSPLFFKVIEDAIEKNIDLHDINDPLFTYVLQHEYFEPELKSCVNSYKNKKEKVLLAAALEKNNVQIMNFLLEVGADINQADERGNTLLHSLVEKNMFDSTQLLLAVPSIDINKKNDMGHSPLDTAVAYPFDRGTKDVALLFLDSPRLIINQSDKIKLLYSAVCNNHELVVKKILESGVNVNDHGLQCDTPLHKAINFNLVSMVKMLLGAGADIAFQDCNNKTALDVAQEKIESEFNSIASIKARKDIEKLLAQAQQVVVQQI